MSADKLDEIKKTRLDEKQRGQLKELEADLLNAIVLDSEPNQNDKIKYNIAVKTLILSVLSNLSTSDAETTIESDAKTTIDAYCRLPYSITSHDNPFLMIYQVVLNQAHRICAIGELVYFAKNILGKTAHKHNSPPWIYPYNQQSPQLNQLYIAVISRADKVHNTLENGNPGNLNNYYEGYNMIKGTLKDTIEKITTIFEENANCGITNEGNEYVLVDSTP